jgi:hypothetical protein
MSYVPLTDNKMKKVYTLVVQVRNSIQKNMEVHIFLFQMTEITLDDEKSTANFRFLKNIPSWKLTLKKITFPKVEKYEEAE